MDDFGVSGARKVHAEPNRQGHWVALCTVERLMRICGLRGVTRPNGPWTTTPDEGPGTRPDPVHCSSTADGPDRMLGADITYCRTSVSWVYAAFVIDVHTCRVVGWQLSISLRGDPAHNALETSTGPVPPVEFEDDHRDNPAPITAGASLRNSTEPGARRHPPAGLQTHSRPGAACAVMASTAPALAPSRDPCGHGGYVCCACTHVSHRTTAISS